MLRAVEVGVERGRRTVLRAVSVAVVPGQVLAVLGANGAGKSTLLQLLSGGLAPDHGMVSLDDRPLSEWSQTQLARRRAVLPQASELGFPFRVLDVVSLGRSPHAGRSGRRRDLRIVEAAMTATEVCHLADRVYTSLSGGEKQRVQLARVLAQIWPDDPDADESKQAPRYLLLDEPTNSLDLAHQHALLAVARRFAAQGVGVMAVLHDPNLAALYADRLCILKDGAVLADAAPAVALTEDVILAAFDLRVRVRPHPTRGCPFVYPL